MSMEKRGSMMTNFTKTALEKELQKAQGKLKDASLAIGEAAGQESDWHDNAAFDYANMDFDLKSVNLVNIQKKLHDAEIITPRAKTDRVDVGNSVVVRFEGENENETYTILGPSDSGRKTGWLSCLSPLGSNLIGKREGDTVSFPTERGVTQKIKVVKVLKGDFE